MEAILETTRRFWGHDSLRPLQEEAIRAGIERRDSLVVLPTGGGKSLCYQVPPVVAGRLDVVVSPLISLMKDQVDGLAACGYPAVALHSNQTEAERKEAWEELRSGRPRLLFLSPERLALDGFTGVLSRLGVGAFAVDEAHCISHWGHDFRPEYRRLGRLREAFPEASLHAYTATATERVREDIVLELGLRDPVRLVGRFDRPNLVYRVIPRVDVRRQVLEVLRRHRGEAAIVYRITRKETESLARALRSAGLSAAAYHAGLDKAARTAVQEAFANERIQVVVATVAFGMGIDRSDVRCVIHTALPKSVEHYQQETGRAGRDGLEAECVLLYSVADALRWEELARKGAEETEEGRRTLPARIELIGHMKRFCGTLRCRHRALSLYFGQDYPEESCGACDVCLGEAEVLPDSTETARKILSCVARVGQRFGVSHVVKVLRGSGDEGVRGRGHHRLGVHGILKEVPAGVLTNLVYQLVDQELLDRTGDEWPVLRLNRESMAVLRGEKKVLLQAPAPKRKPRKPRALTAEGEEIDADLFERLRALRREIASKRGIPPYMIFSDRTLRALAARKPETLEEMREVYGIGDKKLADLGPAFLRALRPDPASPGKEPPGEPPASS